MKKKYTRNKRGAITDTIDKRRRERMQALHKAIRALNR